MMSINAVDRDTRKESPGPVSPVNWPGVGVHAPGTPSDGENARARTPSLGFLQNKLRRLSTASSKVSKSEGGALQDTAAQSKGPLGLYLLHEPSEPHVDFVFIHGLGGGSKKTWSCSPEPGMFWPKDWLPNEIGFKHVRIHSYGYNSDWTTRKDSSLTIHDFGQALLADVHNSPVLRKTGGVPLVFVAHSMGGLVAKKAYLLATRDPTYKDIADRLRTIFFLGTPHRGSESASLLKFIRQSAGYGTKAFVDDLLPGSGTLDQINDEFRHVCGNLDLWSFSEGVPTSFGLTSAMVVDKESSILGLPKEHVQYIEADHRNICKFDSPVNSNYIILQRAFLAVIEDMESNDLSQRQEDYRSQMRKIASLLHIEYRPDAVLLATNEKQHFGSCQWLTDHSTFLSWMDIPEDWKLIDSIQAIGNTAPPRVLWLSGRPGTGKSVAAGHVIRYLQSLNRDCSFHFFKHGDKTGTSLSTFLRSMAFQMSESSFEIRRAMVSLAEDEIRLNQDDHHMLWTTLFVDQIFKIDLKNPLFWVIDAVDESSSKALPALVSMLSNAISKTSIRIFLTSRPGGQLGRLLAQEETEVSEIATGENESLQDIENFLKARCLRSDNADSYEGLVADVLAKSNGIFLWASLTVAKLEDAYSIEDKQDILRQIPPEMDDFYTRIVASVNESPSADLAKCILKWTICSSKPLTKDELTEAVRLDIGRTLTASSAQVEAMTGHLVFVDNQSRIVVTHQTMSAFLTKKRDGFWVDRVAAHTRMAELCLTLLCGPDFMPPRVRRGGTASKTARTSVLSEYASINFSHHLLHGSSAFNGLLILLNKFLRSHVMTWIERNAAAHNVRNLQLTAQRLKTYLGRRSKYQSPVNVESQTVATWADDLYHVVAAFYGNLVLCPSSIHFLIPYLCPRNSMIHKLFAKPNKRLRIEGNFEDEWDDRLACYVFPEETSAMACSMRHLAIALSNGDIRIFGIGDSGPFELAASLSHGKKVRHLSFSRASTFLASCSARCLKLWRTTTDSDTGFSCLWSSQLDFTPSFLAFGFHGLDVTLANHQESSLVSFSSLDGHRRDPVLLRPADSDSSDEGGQEVVRWTPAQRIKLDAEHKLAALSYRSSSVCIWDLEAEEEIGKFHKEDTEDVNANAPCLDMLFNPVSELELLAIAYKDGDVVTCNPWTLDQANHYHLRVSLSTLAATSDGRVLAGAAEDGVIYIFLFETLQPIYQIMQPNDHCRIMDIKFTADNLQFLDIRGQSCTVWEPFILVSRDGADDHSSEPQSEEIVLEEPPVSQAHALQWGKAITVVESAVDDDVLFVGRQNGTIDLCDLGNTSVLQQLRLHDGFAEIFQLDWQKSSRNLLSVDNIGRCRVTEISKTGDRGNWTVACLFDLRARQSVRQAILCPGGNAVLICTESNARVLRFDGQLLGETQAVSGSWWTRHPSDSSLLLLIKDSAIDFYKWDNLTTAGVLTAQHPPSPELKWSGASPFLSWTGNTTSNYVAQTTTSSTSGGSGLVAVEIPKLAEGNVDIPVQIRHSESFHIQALLGCLKSTLYFLDTAGWVCSISLKNLEQTPNFSRHFFIPLTWRNGMEPVVKIVSKSAVAFGKGEQLVVFHGFLEFEDKVSF